MSCSVRDMADTDCCNAMTVAERASTVGSGVGAAALLVATAAVSSGSLSEMDVRFCTHKNT